MLTLSSKHILLLLVSAITINTIVFAQVYYHFGIDIALLCFTGLLLMKIFAEPIARSWGTPFVRLPYMRWPHNAQVIYIFFSTITVPVTLISIFIYRFIKGIKYANRTRI